MPPVLRWLQPLLALVVVAVLVVVLKPEPEPPPPPPRVQASPTPTPEEQYAACCANLDNMMHKLREDYGEGAVPMSAVQALTLSYRCPASSSLGYSASGDGTMQNTILFCRGSNHRQAGVPDDFPDIHSQRGLNRGFDPEGKSGIPAPKS